MIKKKASYVLQFSYVGQALETCTGGRKTGTESVLVELNFQVPIYQKCPRVYDIAEDTASVCHFNLDRGCKV